MRKIMLNALLIGGLLIAAENVNAQKKITPKKPMPSTQKAQMQQMEQRRETMRLGFITNSIKLTPAQAKIFWPIYQQQQNESQKIMDDFKNQLKAQTAVKGKMSDAQIQKEILSRIGMKEKLLELDRNYINKYKTAISMEQISKFYKADEIIRNRELSRMEQPARQNPPHRPVSVKKAK